jgi:tripartite-type tricarboxylate transporter receptor subunit TctC
MFKSMANVDMVNVTYRSNPMGITDVMSGVAQVMFVDATTSAPHAREGRVRAIGVTSRQRVSMLPDVPTVEEQGFPGYEMLSWNAVYAPAGTPAPIVQKLHQGITAVQNSEAVQKHFASEGAQIVQMSTPEFAAFIEQEMKKWERVVKEGNNKAE